HRQPYAIARLNLLHHATCTAKLRLDCAFCARRRWRAGESPKTVGKHSRTDQGSALISVGKRLTYPSSRHGETTIRTAHTACTLVRLRLPERRMKFCVCVA